MEGGGGRGIGANLNLPVNIGLVAFFLEFPALCFPLNHVM